MKKEIKELKGMGEFFPTYLIKLRAKQAMRGHFWKTFAISVMPMVIMLLLSACVLLLVPGAREGLDMVTSGSFENMEARYSYTMTVTANFSNAAAILYTLFSFVELGAIKEALKLIRGEEVKISGVFSYYNKWYMALIMPLAIFAAGAAYTFFANVLIPLGVFGAVAAFVLEIAYIILMYKLIFFNYVFADNGCEDFFGSLKKAWGMVKLNTAFNVIVLALSFIGWILLAMLTAGIALFYLIPYMYMANTMLYEMNREKTEIETEIEPE